MAFGLLSRPMRTVREPVRIGDEYRLSFTFSIEIGDPPRDRFLNLTGYTISVTLRETADYNSAILATFTNDLVNAAAGVVQPYLTKAQTSGLTAAGIGGYLHATINGAETNSTDFRFAKGAIPFLKAAV